MKVKNKTVKVITIGTNDILPDAVVDIPQEAAENPVVKAFLARKFLVEIPDTMDDEAEETPEDIAAQIKGMQSSILALRKRHSRRWSPKDRARWRSRNRNIPCAA